MIDVTQLQQIAVNKEIINKYALKINLVNEYLAWHL